MSDDDVRGEYEEFRRRFRNIGREQFESGQWFADLVQWLLSKYAHSVDADYIRRRYPGAGATNHAKKAIALAARHNAIAGGVAASAVTGLELSSLGPQAAITIPAAVTLVLADVGYSSRTQLQVAYDLSVIHGAALSVEDVEDCYLIFLMAMGVELHELIGDFAKVVGPKIVAYNVRRLLRAGVRRALQAALQKIGGARLAATLTERAMMRLLVPGINVPIASWFNHHFTTKLLSIANKQMIRRAATIQPLVRAYNADPELPRSLGIRLLIAVTESGDRDSWSGNQLSALRYCQSALKLSDDEIAELESDFDRSVQSVVADPVVGPKAAAQLLELAITQAALASNEGLDIRYASAIQDVAGAWKLPNAERGWTVEIANKRKLLL